MANAHASGESQFLSGYFLRPWLEAPARTTPRRDSEDVEASRCEPGISRLTPLSRQQTPDTMISVLARIFSP